MKFSEEVCAALARGDSPIVIVADANAGCWVLDVKLTPQGSRDLGVKLTRQGVRDLGGNQRHHAPGRHNFNGPQVILDYCWRGDVEAAFEAYRAPIYGNRCLWCNKTRGDEATSALAANRTRRA